MAKASLTQAQRPLGNSLTTSTNQGKMKLEKALHKAETEKQWCTKGTTFTFIVNNFRFTTPRLIIRKCFQTSCYLLYKLQAPSASNQSH